MEHLYKAIGEPDPLAVCSDAWKGLTLAVQAVFPNVEKIECFTHLVQNITNTKHFGGSEHMYLTARAYRTEVFEHHYSNAIAIPGVDKWLKDWHGLLWYRSHFNIAIKCDNITNNIVEVFNIRIKDYKDLPVCQLVDKIMNIIMDLFFRRRRINVRMYVKILPSIVNVLKARARGLGHLSLVTMFLSTTCSSFNSYTFIEFLDSSFSLQTRMRCFAVRCIISMALLATLFGSIICKNVQSYAKHNS